MNTEKRAGAEKIMSVLFIYTFYNYKPKRSTQPTSYHKSVS